MGRVRAVMGVVAAVAMLSGPAAMAKETPRSTVRAVKAVTVPLRLSGTVSEAPVPDVGCRGMHNSPVGRVTGVPLGEAGWASDHCIDAIAEPGILVIRDGRLKLAGEFGVLTGTYSGHASLPDAAGHIYVAVDFSITGGSGQFQGARGGGLLKVVADPIPGVAHVDLAGVLSYFDLHCCPQTRPVDNRERD